MVRLVFSSRQNFKTLSGFRTCDHTNLSEHLTKQCYLDVSTTNELAKFNDKNKTSLAGGNHEPPYSLDFIIYCKSYSLLDYASVGESLSQLAVQNVLQVPDSSLERSQLVASPYFYKTFSWALFTCKHSINLL